MCGECNWSVDKELNKMHENILKRIEKENDLDMKKKTEEFFKRATGKTTKEPNPKS